MTVTLKRGASIVAASHNEGKVRELAELFAPFGVECIPASRLGLPEPEETGASFAENAAIKAEEAARASDMIALADDSGLEVAALDGAPGIHSARWGGPGKDFGLAMARVQRELEAKGAIRRSRQFHLRARACRAKRAGQRLRREGLRHAQLGRRAAPHGFGYDPIFVPDGYTRDLRRDGARIEE